MFASERTVWRGLKIFCATSISAMMSGVIGRTTTRMVWVINNFCVEITLVVSISKITLEVWVVTLGSLFGLLPYTTNFSESLIASPCSAELFLNQFLAPTCSSEPISVLTYSSDWKKHPLNYLTISSRTPAESCLSNDQFASLFVHSQWRETQMKYRM